MTPSLVGLAILGKMLAPAQPFPIQFAQEGRGQMVAICLDGLTAKRSFAGKLVMRDRNSTWQSVCAGVRRPVAVGQTFPVRPWNTWMVGGHARLAGNIVAAHFRQAQSAEECAALQLAVWEAMEDGGKRPDFENGAFAARGGGNVVALATAYYQSADKPGIAMFMQTGNAGQPQIGPAPV